MQLPNHLRIISLAAPSGAGKSTLARYLVQQETQVCFSVSATTRAPREGEEEGKHYYFLSPAEFQRRMAAKAFVEWEEVYEGRYYGTLVTELIRIQEAGQTPLFDVDVNGALRLKELFGERALAVFIQPPSLEALRERIQARQTIGAQELQARLERATYELAQAPKFDAVVVNDNLAEAKAETLRIVRNFLAGKA